MNLSDTIVLLTRPQAAAERFARQMREALGPVEYMISPVLRIEPLGPLPRIVPDAQLVFTSENGIAAYLAAGGSTAHRAYCVGPRSAERALAAGFDVAEGSGTVEALFEQIKEEAPRGPVLHMRGLHQTGDLSARLEAAGITAQSVPLYDQIETPLSAEALALVASDKRVILPLFSPRSAALVGAQICDVGEKTVLVALSTSVAEGWTGPAPDGLHICKAPDVGQMLAILAALLGLLEDGSYTR